MTTSKKYNESVRGSVGKILPEINPMDRPIRGARNIAIVANVLDHDGNPDLRKTFYMLDRRYLDADKRGHQWESTARRLLSPQPKSAPADAA